MRPELPKKRKKQCFFSCFFIRNNIFFHGSPRQNEIRLSFRNTPGIFYWRKMTHAKEVWDEGSKKNHQWAKWPTGFFFMFFANNFFLKIGNLSIETEFRCKNLTLEGNCWLANIFARQFVFLESQNV